jgi:DNA-binding NarL/FixJ family response regulator
MTARRLTLRVLVADDSAPVRERMVSLLGELPHVKVAAESDDVPDTIECVRRLRPHLVLLDISMPGGSGFDVLDMIRAERIPTLVIVLTNHAEPEYETRAFRTGAVAFLDKSRDFLKAIDFIRDFSERTFRHSPGPSSVRGAFSVRRPLN